MKQKEIIRAKSFRVALYKSPLELLRFSFVIVYLLMPFRWGYSLYRNDELGSILLLLILALFTLACLIGAIYLVTEEDESWNSLWRNRFDRASAPVSFGLSVWLLMPYSGLIDRVIKHALDTYLSWLVDLNYILLFIGVFVISFFTLSVVDGYDGKEVKDKFSISGAVGFIICLIVGFIHIATQLVIPVMAAIVSLSIYLLFQRYEDVRYTAQK